MDCGYESPFSTHQLSDWTEVMGSERLTGALLDRLTHRVHIIEANGESYRLKDARKRQQKTKGGDNSSTGWTPRRPAGSSPYSHWKSPEKHQS
ncbi:ATP-binding protein [Verrucomicrobiales bacterium]|nr:ATP-binding protein [Verrucomicrobiales bacterium]MDB4662612.1 ATP-binding protein [Verrucomicrobiales bacterium]MDC0275375.1 ATP-binding protein [Verrucomicrobiales bacterium]